MVQTRAMVAAAAAKRNTARSSPILNVSNGEVPGKKTKRIRSHKERQLETHLTKNSISIPRSANPSTLTRSKQEDGQKSQDIQNPSESDFEPAYLSESTDQNQDPITYWIKKGVWPSGYGTEQDIMDPGMNPVIYNNPVFRRLLARRPPKSVGKGTDVSGTEKPTTTGTVMTSQPRSPAYRQKAYDRLLNANHSFMSESALGITETSESLCENLLVKKQPKPTVSIFDKNVFKTACASVNNRNEARVIRDITPLIAPSAEILAYTGAMKFKLLIDANNEAWSRCIPLLGSCPQPDVSVGFKEAAFSKTELEKLRPYIGNPQDRSMSLFMATDDMYFPFFTCEVKSSSEPIKFADRQNAHSMTVAARGILELFRAVGREQELHREILAFCISHDNNSVNIYGEYPVIKPGQGEAIEYYQHSIAGFTLSAMNGRDRWTGYSFTKSVYDTWAPKLLEKIKSAIAQLPDPQLGNNHNDGPTVSLTPLP